MVINNQKEAQKRSTEIARKIFEKNQKNRVSIFLLPNSSILVRTVMHKLPHYFIEQIFSLGLATRQNIVKLRNKKFLVRFQANKFR